MCHSPVGPVYDLAVFLTRDNYALFVHIIKYMRSRIHDNVERTNHEVYAIFILSPLRFVCTCLCESRPAYVRQCIHTLKRDNVRRRRSNHARTHASIHMHARHTDTPRHRCAGASVCAERFKCRNITRMRVRAECVSDRV